MSVAVEAAAVVAALDRLGVRRQRMTLDSRDIKPGDVFVALPGSRVDGRQFVRAALDAGAAAVLHKPFTLRKLISLVAEVLDAGPPRI